MKTPLDTARIEFTNLIQMDRMSGEPGQRAIAIIQGAAALAQAEAANTLAQAMAANTAAVLQLVEDLRLTAQNPTGIASTDELAEIEATLRGKAK